MSNVSRFKEGDICQMASGSKMVVSWVQYCYLLGKLDLEKSWIHFKDPSGCNCDPQKDLTSNSLSSRQMPQCNGKRQCSLTTVDYCDLITIIIEELND